MLYQSWRIIQLKYNNEKLMSPACKALMLYASDARHEKSDFPIGKSLNFNVVRLP